MLMIDHFLSQFVTDPEAKCPSLLSQQFLLHIKTSTKALFAINIIQHLHHLCNRAYPRYYCKNNHLILRNIHFNCFITSNAKHLNHLPFHRISKINPKHSTLQISGLNRMVLRSITLWLHPLILVLRIVPKKD